MADATLIAAIRKAASQTGANPVLLVATSLVESGATWYPTPGDNDTSFGPFQFHIGGALGSSVAVVVVPAAWRRMMTTAAAAAPMPPKMTSRRFAGSAGRWIPRPLT